MNKMASKEPAEHVIPYEEILKSCGGLDDHEKLKIFTSKYDELFKIFRNLEFCYNTTKRELSSVNAEKNKQVLVRSRLEGLCRELQKQNKVIKDESLLKIHEEEEKRKQVTQEFQKTLNNVTTMMTESNAQNNKLGEENKQMAERLTSIYEEFKSRENEVDRISRQIDIERQLAEARCDKMKTEFMIEKQTLMSEKDVLKEKIARVTKELLETTKKSVTLEYRVSDLTNQLDKYTGKYEEFESTITKSGKVFDHCKTEINKMNKQITILEKEIVEWQNRYHKNISTIYELQMESNEKSKHIEYMSKKQKQLTKLCRQLQSERLAYINTLRSLGQNPNDIVIEPIEDDPELEEPSTSKFTDMPAASVDCCLDRAGDKLLGRKPAQKAKRGKQKGKKGKDFRQELGVVIAPPMTLKEIQLAELKQELRRVQDQVAKIQSPSLSITDLPKEGARDGTPVVEQVVLENDDAKVETEIRDIKTDDKLTNETQHDDKESITAQNKDAEEAEQSSEVDQAASNAGTDPGDIAGALSDIAGAFGDEAAALIDIDDMLPDVIILED